MVTKPSPQRLIKASQTLIILLLYYIYNTEYAIFSKKRGPFDAPLSFRYIFFVGPLDRVPTFLPPVSLAGLWLLELLDSPLRDSLRELFAVE